MRLLNSRTFEAHIKSIPTVRFNIYPSDKLRLGEKNILVLSNSPVNYSAELLDDFGPLIPCDSFEQISQYYSYEQKLHITTLQNFITGTLGSHNMQNPTNVNGVKLRVEYMSYSTYFEDFSLSVNKGSLSSLFDRLRSLTHEKQNEIAPTHIICWGKEIFGSIINSKRYQVLKLKSLRKKGYGYALVHDKINHKKIHVLKYLRPSMPNFNKHNSDTEEIFEWFYAL